MEEACGPQESVVSRYINVILKHERFLFCPLVRVFLKFDKGFKKSTRKQPKQLEMIGLFDETLTPDQLMMTTPAPKLPTPTAAGGASSQNDNNGSFHTLNQCQNLSHMVLQDSFQEVRPGPAKKTSAMPGILGNKKSFYFGTEIEKDVSIYDRSDSIDNQFAQFERQFIGERTKSITGGNGGEFLKSRSGSTYQLNHDVVVRTNYLESVTKADGTKGSKAKFYMQDQDSGAMNKGLIE